MPVIEPEFDDDRNSGINYSSNRLARRLRPRPLTGEQELSRMYQQQLRDFNLYQRPVIDALEDEASSNALVERGIDQARKLKGKVSSITQRQIKADGNALLPSQRAALNRRVDRNTSLGAGAMITGARDAQKVRRVAARQQLMSIAENLQATGVANTADAAAKFEARRAAAKKARSGFMSSALGIAGTVIGGAFGGPAGAAIGGSIGSSVGQGIGG